MTIDRDAVVIPKRNQFAKAQCARQRTRLVRDAFHQTTITHEHISEVVNDVVTRFVELRRQCFFSHRHADRIGNTLA